MDGKSHVGVELVQISQAVSALLQHISNVRLEAQKSKNSASPLFEDDDTISVIIALKKIPEKVSVKPIQIDIPHPLFGEDAEICVFVKDPQSDFKKLFDQQGVKVSKVIGLAKLRANYKRFEEKRKLCNSYNLFLTDSRIVHFLPKLLGKAFFLKKRQPIPIDLTRNIPLQLQKARCSTSLFFTGGACCAIRAARTSFSPNEVVENVAGCIKSAVERIPKKWKNIQSIHIKTSTSVALPLYNSLPLVPVKINVPAGQNGALIRDNIKSPTAMSSVGTPFPRNEIKSTEQISNETKHRRRHVRKMS